MLLVTERIKRMKSAREALDPQALTEHLLWLHWTGRRISSRRSESYCLLDPMRIAQQPFRYALSRRTRTEL